MSKVSMILNMISIQKKFLVRAAQIGVRNISISSALRKNHYETLGVPRDATQAEIKNAYFELSKLYHPDRIAATDENIAKFREVSAAYEILGNEQSRRLYDRGLLGDLKKPGEEEEITDPIIKFYKQRQESSRQEQAVGMEDLDAWSQTYFAEAKKRATKQHQLYTQSKRREEETEQPMRYAFQFGSAFILTLLFLTNFKDTQPEKAWRKFTNCACR